MHTEIMKIVQFIGVVLGEKVIPEYLKYTVTQKCNISIWQYSRRVCEGDKWLDAQRNYARI